MSRGTGAFASSSESGARGHCSAPGTHCNLPPQPPPPARSMILPGRGDGPAECNGADPEAVGRAAGSREETKCFP